MGVLRWLSSATRLSSPLQAPHNPQQQAPWQDVTPRAGLAGWHTAGGQAPYRVVDGEVVGSAVPNSANSWLVSDALYGDFILEFEFTSSADVS